MSASLPSSKTTKDGALNTPHKQLSRLQLKLSTAINLAAEDDEIAAAFPELRCTFTERSIVPDIAVVRWAHIPFTAIGEVNASALAHPPAWTIEILSPGQSSTKVIDNILFCIEQGTELGWLIDPEERGIFVFLSQQPLRLYRTDEIVPVLGGIELELTADRVFKWLKMGRSHPATQE